MICNTLGIEYLIGNMTWDGSKGFKVKMSKEKSTSKRKLILLKKKKGTEKLEWKIDGKLAGYYTRDRNLTYVVIKDGSHMVPYDKPIECLDMINRFMQVGDNVVKGKQSQVGDLERKEDTHKDSMPEQEDRAKKVGDKTWSAYYSLGTVASAAILLLFLVLGCYLCTRSKRPSPTAEFGGAPRQEREGVKKPGVLAYIKNLFKNNGNHQKKLRLGDQDETNEL